MCFAFATAVADISVNIRGRSKDTFSVSSAGPQNRTETHSREANRKIAALMAKIPTAIENDSNQEYAASVPTSVFVAICSSAFFSGRDSSSLSGSGLRLISIPLMQAPRVMVPAKDGIFRIRGNAESITYGRQTAARGTNPTLTASSSLFIFHQVKAALSPVPRVPPSLKREPVALCRHITSSSTWNCTRKYRNPRERTSASKQFHLRTEKPEKD